MSHNDGQANGHTVSSSLMDSDPTVQQPVAPTAPADPVAQRTEAARQFRYDPNKGFFQQLTENPFFTAGFGLAGLGAGLSLAQRGLRQGAALLRRRMLVDVEINIKDDSYAWFLHWMTLYQRSQLEQGVQGGAQKLGAMEKLFRKFTPGMHHLSIQTEKVEHTNGSMHTQFSLIPGPGKHILRYKNAFIFVDRQREAKSRDLATGKPWETVTLTTLYAHRHIFQDLFQEAHDYAEKAQEGKTVIYNSWGAEWKPFGNPRRKRPIESVVLDRGIKERLVDDVKDFLASGHWYYDRGIPYRRGYLLHGPPGSGKSSFIQALAGELDYDIAILNLSERGLTDDRLNHLLTIIPPRTIVLLEDVDAAFSNRRVQTDDDGYRGANVTFSGLLNALDGVASAEERVLFLTTNHPDRLDEALIRPGRVDMIIRLGEATRYQVSKLWKRFYGELDPDEVYEKAFLDKLYRLGLIENEQGQKLPQSQTTSIAALQGLFLYNKGNASGAIEMADALVDDE